MFGQISGDCGLAKLTHKTNHHKDVFSKFALDLIADSALYGSLTLKLSSYTISVLTLFISVFEATLTVGTAEALYLSDHTTSLSFASICALCRPLLGLYPWVVPCSTLNLASLVSCIVDLAYRFLTQTEQQP